MKERFFVYLARQLLPALEPLIRAEAAKIVAALQEQIRAEAGRCWAARRFIGGQQ